MRNWLDHYKYHLFLLLAGLAVACLALELTWLDRWYRLHLAGWFYSLSFWGGILVIIVYSLYLRRRNFVASRIYVIAATLFSVGLVYLFPTYLQPGCNGMPKAFASCPAQCVIPGQCNDWQAYPCSLCSAADHAAGKCQGCCFSYDPDTCDPTCNTPSDSPPTITAVLNCSVDGSGGWCRSGASITLTASDPQGYTTTIHGDINGTNFSCPAGSTCTRNLPEANGSINYAATSASSNLSSAVGSKTYKYDPTAPGANLSVSGTAGSNGWYISDVTVTDTGSDTTSGVASHLVSKDGGAWQVSLTLTDGTYILQGQTTDHAGNTKTTSSQTFRVDTVVPSQSIAVTAGTPGGAGYYTSDVTMTATSIDATSGIALVEYRMDGGVWKTGATMTISSNGTHTVDFRTTDAAGLRTTGSQTIKLDKTPPTISFTPSGTSGSNGWYTSSVSLAISAADTVSGVSSLQYSLDNGTSWTTGNTVTLGDGVNTIMGRSADLAGNLSTVTTSVKVDTVAPGLSVMPSGTNGKNGWYVSNIRLTATASDATSGIALTEYRIDGGNWVNGASVTISTDGLHTVDIRATDRAGLQTLQTQAVKLDATLPAIVFAQSGTSGANGWYTSSVNLALSASDATSGLSTFQYSLDGGSTWATGNAITLNDGTNTIRAMSTDNAGNQSTATTTVKVDTVAPDLSIMPSGTMGRNGWYVSDITLTANASDAISGIALTEYRVDGGSWISGASAIISSDGSHMIDFRTTDHGGLQTSASQTVQLDKTPPVITFTPSGTSGANDWYTSVVALSFASTDGMSGLATLQYRLDNGLWKTGNKLTVGDGIHAIDIQATDGAGNQATVSTSLKVDTLAPLLTASPSGMSGMSGWYRSAVQWNATSSDATSGVQPTEYQVDGGSWQPGTSVTVGADGSHQVAFRVLDIAGNQVSSFNTFQVDQTAPASSFSQDGRLGTAGWYISPVDVSINPSDATSGVAAVEHRVDGGKWVTGAGFTVADGVHNVESRVTDGAGNQTTNSLTVQVDTVPPLVPVAIAGKAGNADWYLSPVLVTVSPLDVTSSVQTPEYRADGGDWKSGAVVTVSSDGLHTIDFRVVDKAGLQTIVTQVLKIDQTKPVSAFTDPQDGSTGLVIKGLYTLMGHSSDTTSGLSDVEISLDGGASWRPVTGLLKDGVWFYGWLTSSLPNGTYRILARARDLAGNQENTAHVSVVLANQAPIVKVQQSWWIWESGSLKVSEQAIPVHKITLTIDCGGGQPGIKLDYTSVSALPSSFQWDRRCGDGHLAEMGDHAIRVTACDLYGNCGSDTGVIQIPFIVLPQPTWTPTIIPTSTATSRPTSPSSPRTHPQPTATVFIPAPVSSVVPPHKIETDSNMPIFLLPALGFVGLLMALASASLSDGRPRALRRLAEILRRMPH